MTTREGNQSVGCEVITTLEDLQAVGAEWNSLLSTSRNNNLFLTWEWVSTWCQVYAPRDLYIVVVRSTNRQIVGIAPLRLVRRSAIGAVHWNAVAFIGHGKDVTPEYLDFIVRDGWEDRVIPAILDLLMRDDQIGEVDLEPIAAHSPDVPAILSRLRTGNGITRHIPISRCPIAALPRTRGEFLAGRSRNYRKKIGEYERRCNRNHGSRLRLATSPEDVRQDLEALRELHLARWGSQTRAFRSEQYMTFHTQFALLMLAQSQLRLFTMESEARPIAVSYCFHYDSRYYFYQAGRDPSVAADRAGLVLMHRVLQEAIDEGAAVFDFLSGQEPYKYRWATDEAGSDQISHWKTKSVFMAAWSQRALDAIGTIPDRSGLWKARG